MASTGSETKRLPAPKDGAVLVTIEASVTEREIVEDRESIVQRLHASYLNLVDEMAEYQKEWDENPALAFLESSWAGFSAGGADWLHDQAELFEKKTWVDLGGKIGEAAGTAYDRLAGYTRQRYDDLQKDLNKHIEHPEDTFYNWAWWQATITEQASAGVQRRIDEFKSAQAAVESSVKTVLNTAEMAGKIYKHRAAILNLPALIADGEPRPIQAFVENELMDIDPDFAKAVRYDKNFPLVLEIIADHDSALTYLSYVGLMLEAIPPNFYGYVAGKGGAYLLIEVVLLIVTALISAGTAAAARIVTLVARFATAGAKAVSANKKLQRAKATIDAFLRIIEDFSDAADDLQRLGMKLNQARSKPYHAKGNTRTTLQAKKESIKRDKKCRRCGSSHHSTPRIRLGTVVYR